MFVLQDLSSSLDVVNLFLANEERQKTKFIQSHTPNMPNQVMKCKVNEQSYSELIINIIAFH